MTINMKYSRTSKIILIFFFFCFLVYFISLFIRDKVFQILTHKSDGFTDFLLNLGFSNIVTTLGYFITINVTSLVGLIVAIKRKDLIAKKAFKIITIMTLGFTTLYFTYLQLKT